MGKIFNPPPNWPKPPEDWMPPHNWTPDPRWGPVPEGWELYRDETAPEKPLGSLKDKSAGGTRRGRRWEVATNWISASTAVAALILSAANYAQLNSEANVHMTMPYMLRIQAPGDHGFQHVYLQPTFTATKRTDRPTVLLNMTLTIEAQEDGGDMPLFPWHEVVELTQPEADDSKTWRRRVSDPVPISVTGSEPVSPMAWFYPTAPNPTLTVGKLQATLLVEWQNKPDMTRSFCLEISQEAVDAFADTEQDAIHRFIKSPSSECYTFLV